MQVICRQCQRPMYTSRTIDSITPLYRSGAFATDWDALNRDYGWQSAWTPSLCRQCDTEHDHRKQPHLPWLRGLTRRLAGGGA